MFPLPILYAAGAFLGMAVLSDLAQQQQQPQRRRRSVEACTAQLQAMWVKEDGVLRVYHEVTDINCTRIVVECTERPSFNIPGQIEGHPVLIRHRPQGQFGAITEQSAEVQAANRALKFLQSTGRQAIPWPDGKTIGTPERGRSRVQVTGPDLSARERGYLGYLQSKFDLGGHHWRLQTAPVDVIGQPRGPDLWQITFER